MVPSIFKPPWLQCSCKLLYRFSIHPIEVIINSYSLKNNNLFFNYAGCLYILHIVTNLFASTISQKLFWVLHGLNVQSIPPIVFELKFLQYISTLPQVTGCKTLSFACCKINIFIFFLPSLKFEKKTRF